MKIYLCGKDNHAFICARRHGMPNLFSFAEFLNGKIPRYWKTYIRRLENVKDDKLNGERTEGKSVRNDDCCRNG